MLHLHTDSSPNGFKATIALEELGLPYVLHHVRLEAGQNRRPEFLALNPHGRIPVLVDDQSGITLFESAAILLYLAERTGRLIPPDAPGRWAAITWLMFHSASMGPALGNRVQFELLEAQKHAQPIARFRRLTNDAAATLDARLGDNEYLAGSTYSIADIATFGWLHIARIVDFDFGALPNLARWHEKVAMRPGVRRGIVLPEPATGA
jgi:GSH-dependent disulfide-bond oxidoreductase